MAHPYWHAQRDGHDWVDQNVLASLEWLTSTVRQDNWARRISAVREQFDDAKKQWAAGNPVPLYKSDDMIAWYLFQAQAYAMNREDWYEPEAFRISPVFTRLGQLLPDLKKVDRIMERVETLMTAGRRQPDDGLFELLVAGNYKRKLARSTVAFVAEKPGVSKTQDILISRNRHHWAVECKRVNRSGYEAEERNKGELLAAPVHELCRRMGRSLILEVVFRVELNSLPNEYLSNHVQQFLSDPSAKRWSTTTSSGQIREVNWVRTQDVLSHDDVFFGSSRMVELFAGVYLSNFDHSVSAKWTPAPLRPMFATAVSQTSVVSWRSESKDAAFRKARHFRSLIAKATEQLPNDLRGVIHVGYEARDGNSVDYVRHIANHIEAKTFDSGSTPLRWVYGHYFTPEHTTAQNESFAVSETTAFYKMSRYRPKPLDHFVLFGDDDGRPGHHW